MSYFIEIKIIKKSLSVDLLCLVLAVHEFLSKSYFRLIING